MPIALTDIFLIKYCSFRDTVDKYLMCTGWVNKKF